MVLFLNCTTVLLAHLLRPFCAVGEGLHFLVEIRVVLLFALVPLRVRWLWFLWKRADGAGGPGGLLGRTIWGAGLQAVALAFLRF